MFCSGGAISQDLNQSLSEAKGLCTGLTASNRAMAKAAGYDLDKLCTSLESVDMAGLSVDELPEILQLTLAKPYPHCFEVTLIYQMPIKQKELSYRNYQKNMV